MTDCVWKPSQFICGLDSAQPAFPDQDHSPPDFEQPAGSLAVAPNISIEFSLPEFNVAGRRRCILTTLMPMPVAPMYEKHYAMAWKNKIWRTGQLPVVQAIAQALAMQEAPDQEFRPRVLAANPRHHSRPDFGRDDVHHGSHYSSRHRGDQIVLSSPL